ncbi:MAG: alginate lyase family protein, partial [Pseudomonadota bacterium]
DGTGGSGGAAGGQPTGFLHPGLLHADADFARMKSKVDAGAEPWLSGWQKLTANAHAQLTWTARPVAMVYRGADGTHPENYAQLFNDAAAAYALAVRWKVSGDARYADKAVAIPNAWAAVLVGIGGTSDKFLAAGLYGYQLANAAEILRSYTAWSAADFARFKTMMLTVFYPMNHDFLVHHNGACIGHYWANWDLCNMDSVLAIGVLTDDRAMYDEAITYFKTGAGNGSIDHAVVTIQPGNLGQWQESGRDQGHNTLGIGLMGAFCEMAWQQGDDLYGYEDNRFLAGAEYVAKYNLGNDVPYTTYDNCDTVNQTVISPTGRGDGRPIWELVFNHYVNRRHVPAPYTAAYAAQVRPEGGGGDYGPNSGGYDQLGYGTLTATLDPVP